MYLLEVRGMSYREIKEEYERAIKDPSYFDSKRILRFDCNKDDTFENMHGERRNIELKDKGGRL